MKKAKRSSFAKASEDKKPVQSVRNVIESKPKKKTRWKGVRKKTLKRKTREKKGTVTYYKLFGKARAKYKDKVYAASVSLLNPHKGKHSLTKWSNDVDKLKSIPGVDKLIAKQKGRGKPIKCTIIVIQRNRVKPHRLVPTNYMSGVAMKINEKNVKSFVVGVLQGHEENIRQTIIRRGYRDKKYDEGNFKAWHVPYIDVTIHYKIGK